MLTCDHDVVNIIRRTPLGQIIIDSANVIDVQKAAFWLTEETRVVLDRISFRWSVYDGEHLFQMVLDQLQKLALEYTTVQSNDE